MESKISYSSIPSKHLAISPLSVMLLCVLIMTSSHYVYSFNLDIRTATVHRGDRDSMFGYSVAQHMTQTADGPQYWALVGAPKAQTVQPGVERPGAVYRCRVDADICNQLPVDEEGNDKPWTGQASVQIEEKSHQMLGASVHSSDKNGVMVACAPNYVYFTSSRDRREPVGTCYVSGSNSNTFTKISPCQKILHETDKQQARFGELPSENTPYGYKSQGHCQSGFSAMLTSDAARLVTGAIGSYFWQGQVFSQDISNRFDTLQTPEHPDKDSYDYAYMGYSIAMGKFDDDLIEDYVVGSPRKNLTGRVTVMTDQLQPIVTLEGRQLGEYFGYSVTVGDFNGDKLDDIAVGAPFYTNYKSDQYETGRVHIFYQTSPGNFISRRTLLTGSDVSVSRFGLSVSAVSDLNNDGFDDLAVGAPYDGPEGHGAVYIFNGASDGLRTEPSQIIQAQDINQELKTFGFSLSGGRDHDKNFYPDILIGAYASDRSVALKSRPIIKVDANMRLEPKDIILDNKDKKLCNLLDGTLVTCFTVKSCMKYDGVRTPAEIVLRLQWTLDSNKNVNQRALVFVYPYQSNTRTLQIKLMKRQENCQSFIAFIKPEIRDKLTPIAIQLNYTLVDPTNPPLGEPTAMLDEQRPSSKTIQANIKKNCGSDNICIPNLGVTAFTSVDKYILGTTSKINIKVRVRNEEEGSYESLVHMLLPPGVNYVNIDNINSGMTVNCRAGNDTEAYTGVICDIGNPLPERTTVGFTLKSTVNIVNYTMDMLSYTFTVNSSNPERSEDVLNNIATVNIPITAESSIRLSGVSNPDQILHNATKIPDILTEEDIGPQVIHLYEVRNTGTSSIDTVSVVIDWPVYFTNGFTDLMYLPIMPRVTRGQGQCFVSGVNYRNLTVIPRDEVDLEMYYGSLLNVFDQEPEDNVRRKRAIFGSSTDKDEYIKTVDCTSPLQPCSRIECSIGPLEPDGNALIRIVSRVWINTIIELQSSFRGFIITSTATASVTRLPQNIRMRERYTDTFQIETYVAALNLRPTDAPIPWWVIALAVVMGFLILLLLTLLLRKCGFFKRKKVLDQLPPHSGIVHKNNGVITPQRSSPVRTYHYEPLSQSETGFTT